MVSKYHTAHHHRTRWAWPFFFLLFSISWKPDVFSHNQSLPLEINVCWLLYRSQLERYGVNVSANVTRLARYRSSALDIICHCRRTLSDLNELRECWYRIRLKMGQNPKVKVQKNLKDLFLKSWLGLCIYTLEGVANVWDRGSNLYRLVIFSF